MNDGINVLDEVVRDGKAVSALLLEVPYTVATDTEVIKSLTREQKVLFLKYAAFEDPKHFGFYNKIDFNKESDDDLSRMVEELNWIWK